MERNDEGSVVMRQFSGSIFRAILQSHLVAALCVGGALLLAMPTQAMAKATAIDHTSCKAAKPIKNLVGSTYMFTLTTASGKHELGLVSCSSAGAPTKGHIFTLYDLNGGSLYSGDKVAIKGPHGRLLGVPSAGKLAANRTLFRKTENFTIQRIGKKGQLIKNKEVQGKVIKGKIKATDPIRIVVE